MAKTPQATSDTLEPPVNVDLTERRYIYGGESPRAASEFAPRGNRPVKHERRSPFMIIVLLLCASLLIVFYVWNKIAVNRLVVEVNDLKIQQEKILNANEFLRAEINKKSGLERIGKVATGQLGLLYPTDQPVWFEVDAGRLERVKQE